MKKYLLFYIYFGIINVNCHSQSAWLERKFKEFSIQNNERISMNVGQKVCADVYASTDNYGRTFFFNDCDKKIELDTLYNFKNYVGNSNEYFYLFVNSFVTYDKNPILIQRKSYDSINYLDGGNFIGFKGKDKWILNCDSLQYNVNNVNKIEFIGYNYFVFKGGIMAPIDNNGSIKLNYLQYTNYIVGENENHEYITDPNFHYLKPDMKFEADSILIFPDNFNETAIIINNDNLYVYSFCEDTIIESEIDKYFEAPIYNYPIIVNKEYIAFGGCNWKKMNIKNIESLIFIEEGDLLYGEVKTALGESFLIDFFENKFKKK